MSAQTLPAPKKLYRSWAVSEVMPRDRIAWAAPKKLLPRVSPAVLNRPDGREQELLVLVMTIHGLAREARFARTVR
jgi:hypothetical protein